MKMFNLFCAGAVLICAVVLSYHHSVELMAAGGYQGIYRHLAVVLAELTFLAGAANVVLARIQKRTPGVPPVLGALFGVALTGWANISAGLAYGMTGVLLGAMVPVALVISEAILAHFLLRGAGATSQDTTTKVTSESTSRNTATSHQTSATTNQTTSLTSKESTSKDASKQDTSDKHPTTTKRRSGQAVDIEVERAKKVAKEIMEREGKPPGRPRLMREAGVKENAARKALEKLKKAQ